MGGMSPGLQHRFYQHHNGDVGVDAVVEPPRHELVVDLGEHQLPVDPEQRPEHWWYELEGDRLKMVIDG